MSRMTRQMVASPLIRNPGRDGVRSFATSNRRYQDGNLIHGTEADRNMSRLYSEIIEEMIYFFLEGNM